MVDDDRDAIAGAIVEQVVEQRRLTRTKKAREHLPQKG
jgi:hypothetical protein